MLKRSPSDFAVFLIIPWDWWNWRWLEKYGRTADFLMYKMQVAEVKGDLSDIVDLFVRINSTGKALTSSERRHARFYTGKFLREAERLARRHRRFLTERRIISTSEIERMKDVELVSELLASILAGGPIHKKQAVDKAVGNESVNGHRLKSALADFRATMRSIRMMFPELASTRFVNLADFYTLFMVVWEMHQQKLLLGDRRRRRVAMKLLLRFSDGVDEVREQQRKAQGARADQRMYADYLLLVQQSTDALSQRLRRAEMIRQLLAGLFERKDTRRISTSEQRRLLWNSEEKKKCAECEMPLDWTNFQVDHIKAHSRGGKTELPNAALVCASCNASKGARRRSRRKSA
jgi:hypothetical protein